MSSVDCPLQWVLKKDKLNINKSPSAKVGGFFWILSICVTFYWRGFDKTTQSDNFLALFIVKMMAGRGSGLPRQSARRLAGFLHTGDIFSDWNFFGIGNSLNISDFLNFKFGTIHAYFIFVTEKWFVFIVSEWFPTVSWVSAWVCRFIKGREVQTPPGWGEIAWRGFVSSVHVVRFELPVRESRTPSSEG